jgi:hypothetical protein
MAYRQEFEQRLRALMQRSPHDHAAWLTMTSGPRTLTPTGLRAILWSMADDGVISPAELTELLEQLDQEVSPPLKADPRITH